MSRSIGHGQQNVQDLRLQRQQPIDVSQLVGHRTLRSIYIKLSIVYSDSCSHGQRRQGVIVVHGPPRAPGPRAAPRRRVWDRRTTRAGRLRVRGERYGRSTARRSAPATISTAYRACRLCASATRTAMGKRASVKCDAPVTGVRIRPSNTNAANIRSVARDRAGNQCGQDQQPAAESDSESCRQGRQLNHRRADRGAARTEQVMTQAEHGLVRRDRQQWIPRQLRSLAPIGFPCGDTDPGR